MEVPPEVQYTNIFIPGSTFIQHIIILYLRRYFRKYLRRYGSTVLCVYYLRTKVCVSVLLSYLVRKYLRRYESTFESTTTSGSNNFMTYVRKYYLRRYSVRVLPYLRRYFRTRKYRYFRTSESTRAYLYEGMYEGTKVQRCPYYGGTFGTFVLSYKNSVSYKYNYYCTCTVRILFSYEDRHFRKYESTPEGL